VMMPIASSGFPGGDWVSFATERCCTASRSRRLRAEGIQMERSIL